MKNKNEKDIIKYAKNCIEHFSLNSQVPLMNVNVQEAHVKCNGLFISMYNGNSQRACMGIVKNNSNIFELIFKVSNLVCLHDDRYPNINFLELSDLKATLWMIKKFYEFKSLDDIKLGMHGIYILSNQYSGLYLPYVAKLNNWNKEEFLVETCKKAECTTNWKVIKRNILLFETEKIEVDFYAK